MSYFAANTARIERDVQRTTSTLESLGTTASRIGNLVGASFSVGALISFGQALMDDADELTRLADKTGVTIEGLERLQVAGDDAGNSLDQLAAAIVRLEDKLASGDRSAGGALEQLDLTLDSLANKTPEGQFIAISDALRKIEDPATRTKLAIDLFGKSGAEVLPTLIRGFDDLKGATVGMSEDTAHALDWFGDKLQAIWRASKGVAADFLVFAGRAAVDMDPGRIAMGEYQRAVDAAAAAQARLIGLIKDPALFRQPTPNGTQFDEAAQQRVAAAIAATDAAVGSMSDQLRRAEKAQAAAEQSAKRHADELERLQDKIADINEGVGKGLFPLSARDMSGAVEDYIGQVQDLLEATDSARSVEAGMLHGGALNIGVQLDLSDAKQSLATMEAMAAKSFRGILSGAMGHLPGLLQKAFTGGGGMGGALKAFTSQIGGGLGEGLFNAGGLLNGLGNKLTGIFGNAFGLALPGIGGALGSVVGPLMGKLFGKLFNDPEKQVNPVRQAYIDAAGGLGVLNQRAAEAGVTLHAILDAKTPEQYQRAIENLNQALKFQDDAMRTLDETAQKYGFTIAELRPAFSRQQLEKQAGDLYQDFKVLQTGGLQVDTILGRMGASINDFVHSALATGTEVPAAMAPMIQRMVELGQLTDESGATITDLDAAGVHFAMTMSEGFEKVVASVTKLTEAIARGLGLAIENIPQPEVTGRVHWQVDGLPGPIDPLDLNVPRFAKGGIVNGPTLAVIGEAGPEAVVPLSQPKGAVVAGGDSGGYREEFAAMRDHIERQGAMLARLPKDIARAVRDKRQLSLVRSRRAW